MKPESRTEKVDRERERKREIERERERERERKRERKREKERECVCERERDERHAALLGFIGEAGSEQKQKWRDCCRPKTPPGVMAAAAAAATDDDGDDVLKAILSIYKLEHSLTDHCYR